jgi:hypothetical protein
MAFSPESLGGDKPNICIVKTDASTYRVNHASVLQGRVHPHCGIRMDTGRPPRFTFDQVSVNGDVCCSRSPVPKTPLNAPCEPLVLSPSPLRGVGDFHFDDFLPGHTMISEDLLQRCLIRSVPPAESFTRRKIEPGPHP